MRAAVSERPQKPERTPIASAAAPSSRSPAKAGSMKRNQRPNGMPATASIASRPPAVGVSTPAERGRPQDEQAHGAVQDEQDGDVAAPQPRRLFRGGNGPVGQEASVARRTRSACHDT